ncbi:hypothetical protein ACP70R_004180 [Stipagrostis hirtigluma subsp. patula]
MRGGKEWRWGEAWGGVQRWQGVAVGRSVGWRAAVAAGCSPRRRRKVSHGEVEMRRAVAMEGRIGEGQQLQHPPSPIWLSCSPIRLPPFPIRPPVTEILIDGDQLVFKVSFLSAILKILKDLLGLLHE